jgi:hypothetical protein
MTDRVPISWEMLVKQRGKAQVESFRVQFTTISPIILAYEVGAEAPGRGPNSARGARLGRVERNLTKPKIACPHMWRIG